MSIRKLGWLGINGLFLVLYLYFFLDNVFHFFSDFRFFILLLSEFLVVAVSGFNIFLVLVQGKELNKDFIVSNLGLLLFAYAFYPAIVGIINLFSGAYVIHDFVSFLNIFIPLFIDIFALAASGFVRFNSNKSSFICTALITMGFALEFIVYPIIGLFKFND